MKAPLPLVPETEIASEGMRSLTQTIGVFFVALRLLIGLMIAWLVCGGFFWVKDYEEAMLFRFGRLVAKEGKEILKSGTWYWRLPYPIDDVKRIPAQRSITVVTAQFWPKQDPNRLSDQQKAPAPTDMNRVLRPGEDGYIVTGDANMMHLLWTLTYRVVDAKQYYLQFYEDPEGTLAAQKPPKTRGVEYLIESILADSVLSEVAGWSVEDVLVLSRQGAVAVGPGPAPDKSLPSAVRQRVARCLVALHEQGIDLGIEVQQISLVSAQAPLAVQQAFREVNLAAQDYQTEIDNAIKYEKTVVPAAEGRASKILADARSYQVRVVESVKASADYFDKVKDEYARHPDTMLVSLHADTVRDLLKKVDAKYVIHAAGAGGQEVRLLLGPEAQKPGGARPPAGDAPK